MHERPIPLLHRDFKPANLVLNMDRTNLKLVDFGVSRELDMERADEAVPLQEGGRAESGRADGARAESGQSARMMRRQSSTASAKLRRVMTHCTGTSRYMSPEVFNSKKDYYDEKSDLYSAALVMWEICAGGCKVFSGGHDADMLIQQSFRDYTRPEITDVQWADVRPLIEAAWATDPKHRPPARELLKRLKQLPGCPPEGDPSPLSFSGGCVPQGCSVQ